MAQVGTRIVSALELDSSRDSRWSNEDLLPTPPEQCTWRWWNYVSFYWSISFTNWTLGSSMIGIGLNWWQSIIVIFVSQMISSIAMAFNSRAASVYHIGFPCVGRSVFGMWGSFYFVGARAVLAIVWYSVQLYYGAEYMFNILRAIFGHHFTDIPNHLPASAHITTQQMLALFLCWMVHLPFCHFRPYQLRGFFIFKTFISLPAMFGLFIFAMVNTGGKIGSVYTQDSKSTTAMAWLIISGINSGLGNTATLITNQPDYCRWAKTKNAPLWTQLISNPIATTLSASLGILATSAINNKYGTSIWNQWDLMEFILDRYWSGTTRFAVFLAAFAWLVQILGTNVAANMISFGADSSMLFPRFINMRRGQYIVHTLAWAVCPWEILASATKFETFLSGYALFMGSVVAIMVCEYFCFTKGNIFIPALYDGTPLNKSYYYLKGWNVQAVLAYIIGIAFPFPGFVGSLGASVSTTATRMGDLGWILSFVTAFVCYFGICWVWPTENQKRIRAEKLGWEAAVDDEEGEVYLNARDVGGVTTEEVVVGGKDREVEKRGL
ncbi:nucleobase cation symporter-1 family protein [Aspergillus aculeatinus CBS 121060]|uniref:Uracil transporter n=1 Tax=Aspergillus aculeatinus CBS 121060 TaxID=1448322 RepID=A0ACD1H467_9EURO|nr:uracil transporter [Aspergillus aculeatinus CBS 121060]RAH68344.1 uracil transporter [Aspergillus aculeatinus CBS 121060]